MAKGCKRKERLVVICWFDKRRERRAQGVPLDLGWQEGWSSVELWQLWQL